MAQVVECLPSKLPELKSQYCKKKKKKVLLSHQTRMFNGVAFSPGVKIDSWDGGMSHSPFLAISPPQC
jgi:hypothetical protein